MIIDGKKLAEEVLEEIKKESRGRRLQLAAVLVGQDPMLKKFVELKKKAGESVGVKVDIYEFPESITTEELEREVEEVLKFKSLSGVIVELPLPKHIDTQKVLNVIPRDKDVDVLSEESQKSFYSGDFSILPPAVEAVKIILEKYRIDPRNKKAAVFGQGLLVGKPVSFWLEKMGANVSKIDEFTENPADISKYCNVVISGVGKGGFITADMIKEDAVIIDFGKDADFESVSKKAGLITPHIGGVGPLVVAAVLKNLVLLSNKKPS